MKVLHYFVLLVVCTLFLLPGCGSKDVHGDLNVTGTQVDNGDGTSDVSFTITYTRPEGGPYDGVNPAITVFFNGAQIGPTTEEFLSSSGTVILTFGAVFPGTITLQAQYGDIIRSDSVTVSATALTVSPTALAFTAGSPFNTLLTSTITGGVAPYSATSDTPDLTVVVVGTTLNIRLNLADGLNTGVIPAIITVRDVAGSETQVNVTY